MGHVPRSIAAVVSIALTAVGHVGAQDAPPPDNAEEPELRTFEFLAHRLVIQSTDNEAMLFDWPAEQYFTEAHAQQQGNQPDPSPKIDWLAHYDGLVWGRDTDHLAAQWFGGRNPGDKDFWKYFDSPDQKGDDLTFPASSRYMGVTNRFVWHGWANTAIDFYPPEHRELETVWVALAIPRQIFLTCVSPEEAFKQFGRRSGPDIPIESSQETLPNGRTRWEFVYKPPHNRYNVILWVDSAGDDPTRQPARWRYVLRDLDKDESLIFMAEWRETTSTSRRTLPALPKDTPGVHHDVERIDTVGVRDRTGLGRWPDSNRVRYMDVTPGDEARNWFSSGTGRWFSNAIVFFALLALLKREHVLHQSKGSVEQ